MPGQRFRHWNCLTRNRIVPNSDCRDYVRWNPKRDRCASHFLLEQGVLLAGSFEALVHFTDSLATADGLRTGHERVGGHPSCVFRSARVPEWLFLGGDP